MSAPTVPTTAAAGTSRWFPARGTQALARRWPAALGLALGLLSVDGLQDGVPLGTALAVAAFGYLLVAVAGRPGLTWPAVLVLLAVVVGLRAAGVAPVPVFAVAAAALAVAAVATGRLGRDLLRRLNAPAAWLFAGVALVATLTSTEVGSLLVAAGLAAHAVWDAVLWRAREPVVARSFVEWCAAFDLVVAVGIVAVVVA